MGQRRRESYQPFTVTRSRGVNVHVKDAEGGDKAANGKTVSFAALPEPPPGPAPLPAPAPPPGFEIAAASPQALVENKEDDVTVDPQRGPPPKGDWEAASSGAPAEDGGAGDRAGRRPGSLSSTDGPAAIQPPLDGDSSLMSMPRLSVTTKPPVRPGVRRFRAAAHAVIAAQRLAMLGQVRVALANDLGELKKRVEVVAFDAEWKRIMSQKWTVR